MENGFLGFLKRFNIPIPEDYEFDPVLDINIEINNLEDWREWYDMIEDRRLELENMIKPHVNKLITNLQTEEWDSRYLLKIIEMSFKFLNFYAKESEFWEKSFIWLVEISPELPDLSPKHLFRIEVLKRDKWTCRKCGKHCNSAHHIYSRTYCQKNAPELEWDIRNGVALCFECHKAITEDGKKWFEENKKKGSE